MLTNLLPIFITFSLVHTLEALSVREKFSKFIMSLVSAKSKVFIFARAVSW